MESGGVVGARLADAFESVLLLEEPDGERE